MILLWRSGGLILLCLTLVACTKNIVQLPTIVVTDSASIKGVTLSGRITQLAFYNKCGSEHTVPARVNYSDADFNKPAVKIPSGKRIYFTYGTIDTASTCKVFFSLVPQAKQNYIVDYYRKFGGCHVDVRSQNGKSIQGLEFYKEKPGQPWLHCAVF